MATIFTLAEARAFPYQGQVPLSDATAYPDALIEDAAERITEGFENYCRVAFAPTEVTRILNGSGDGELVLPDPLVTAIDTVEEWDGSTWSASALSYRLLDSGILYADGGRWWRGRGRLRVAYTHGYATVPSEIKRAALILAVEELAGSNISARATQQTDQNGTFNLAVPGWKEGQPYGLPIVDSTLNRYRKLSPMIG